MVKARTWFTLFMVSVSTVAATASCGSDEGLGGAGGGGTIISGGGNSSVGRAGGASGGGSSAALTNLGIECTSDAQCGGNMVCIKANSTTFGDGGPSNGMCTLKCTPNNQGLPTECDTLKAGILCLDFGTTDKPAGYCLDTCEVESTPVDIMTKCAGRSDFVCFQSSQLPAPVCVPHCLSDAECGPNLYCDKSSPLGLCVKTKPTGDPVGTPCELGGDPTCAGVCLRLTAGSDVGACAELCSYGGPCMFGSGNNPSPGGFCGGGLTEDPGLIDTGYCLANCSCSGDCKFPGDLCSKWPDDLADVADALGAPGVCFPNANGTVELSCGEGGAGGAAGAAGAAGEGPVTPAGGTGGTSGGASGGASGGVGGN